MIDTAKLDKVFKLTESGTNVRTEVLAGVTTFVTMAYILAVNPAILSDCGMDPQAVLMATALSAFVGTMCMALMANYPFALAPGLGLNAFFAYTICGQMGHSWQFALLAVLAEGLVFIILSLTRVREAIFNAFPDTLKKGITVGIGLFVAFIGMQGANLVVKSQGTLVQLIDFNDNFGNMSMTALLALAGLLAIIVLHIKRVKGAILIGTFGTWLMGVICQVCGVYQVDPEHGFNSLLPVWSDFNLASIGLTFGQCFNTSAIGQISWVDFLVIMFSFLMVDMFDTIGTLVGVAGRASMLDSEGKLPRINQALMADAVATTAGAVLGTSTVSTYVESSAGVLEGGKTGLASIVTALLFLLAIFLAPVFTVIPSFATAPALIFVGFMMVSAIVEIDFNDPYGAIPAYICLLCMP
ncbi:NCS2 family permease, partial [bacterium]|nr:NCS2 family permease [bacterium]